MVITHLLLSITHIRQSRAKNINVKHSPTSSNFQLRIVLRNLREISFYSSPLEMVHPVLQKKKSLFKSLTVHLGV